MRKFQKYQIIEGDTLEYVARKFKILSAEELRSFHNTNCKLEQMIGYELKPESIILIPSHEDIERVNERIQQREKERLLNKNKIQLNEYKKLYFIPTQLNANYNIEITNQKPFEIQLKWKERYLNKHIISIKFKGFEIIEITSLQDILQLDFLKLLDIVITTEGKFISIDNAPKIRTQWKENKAFLFEKYSDANSLKHLMEFEEIIQHTFSINEIAVNNLIISLFFNDLYSNVYSSDFTSNYQTKFSFFNEVVVLKSTANEQLTENDCIKINQMGMIENKKILSTEIFIDKKLGCIEAYSAHFQTPDNKSISIQINKK